jgi:hypothetical protein
VGTFLKNNFGAIVGGAVVTAGGLWLWDRFMKKRAERAARRNATAAGGEMMLEGKQVNVVLDPEGGVGRKTAEGVKMMKEAAAGEGEGDGLLDSADIGCGRGTELGAREGDSEFEKEGVCADCEHC